LRIRSVIGAVLAAATAASVASAQNSPPPAAPEAVSPCTDLPESDCTTTSGCVWLPGYRVATGATVNGYCRPAPKPLTARRGPGASTPKDPAQ